MTLAAITFSEVMVTVHILAVVVAFGGALAYPIWFRMIRNGTPEPRAFFHRAQDRLGKFLITPEIVVVFTAGAYLTSDQDVWDEGWVLIPDRDARRHPRDRRRPARTERGAPHRARRGRRSGRVRHHPSPGEARNGVLELSHHRRDVHDGRASPGVERGGVRRRGSTCRRQDLRRVRLRLVPHPRGGPHRRKPSDRTSTTRRRI
jgi:hypothetical protein